MTENIILWYVLEIAIHMIAKLNSDVCQEEVRMYWNAKAFMKLFVFFCLFYEVCWLFFSFLCWFLMSILDKISEEYFTWENVNKHRNIYFSCCCYVLHRVFQKEV